MLRSALLLAFSPPCGAGLIAVDLPAPFLLARWGVPNSPLSLKQSQNPFSICLNCIAIVWGRGSG